MKRFFRSFYWRAFALTGLGVCIGVLTLLLSAVAYPAVDGIALFKTYLTQNTEVAAKLEADIREALLRSSEAREKAAPVGRTIDISIDDILEE